MLLMSRPTGRVPDRDKTSCDVSSGVGNEGTASRDGGVGFRRHGRRIVKTYRIEPTITAARQGLNVLWGFGVVFQGLSQLCHCHPETVVKVLDVGILPHLLADFFPSDDLSAVFQKDDKDTKWLILESNYDTVTAEFTCANRELEITEPEGAVRRRRAHYLQRAPRGGTEIR